MRGNMETNELVLQAKNDNQIAFTQLCQQYEPLLISMANKYSAMCKDGVFDEFLQESQIALHKAIVSYNFNGTTTFGAYAKRVVNNRLIDLVRRMNSKKRKRMDSASISDEEIVSNATPQDEVVWRELGEKLMKKVEDLLSPYERNVLSMLISGHKAKEISLLIGKDEKSVNNAVFRIRSKLKGIY